MPESHENAPDGTPERLIQRLENATPGSLFYCEADREEAVEIAQEEIATAYARGRRDMAEEAATHLERKASRTFQWGGHLASGIIRDCASDIRALVANTPEPAKETGWRPIEEAPANKAIQVFVPGLDYYGNEGVYAGMLVDMGTGPRWMTFAWAMGRDMIGENRPTHWRPLPTPPAIEALVQEEGRS